MWNYIAIAIGGTLGCWARYGLSGWMQNAMGRGFPFATLLINVMGSFLMGFLFIAMLERVTVSPALRVGILTGGLGGFTTFSTFSLEIFLLMEEGQAAKAMLYLGLSVILGLLGAYAGAYIARNL